jgi:hypothetical protein
MVAYKSNSFLEKHNAYGAFLHLFPILNSKWGDDKNMTKQLVRTTQRKIQASATAKTSPIADGTTTANK